VSSNIELRLGDFSGEVEQVELLTCVLKLASLRGQAFVGPGGCIKPQSTSLPTPVEHVFLSVLSSENLVFGALFGF
jgi:hypothetical protein